MKTKLILSLVIFAFFFNANCLGQVDIIPLSSSQFLKGLENQDYLRKVLSDNGFTMRAKWKVKNLKGGIYEYWDYDSLVYVDMILMRGQKADITVRIVNVVQDLPIRLLETFPFSETSSADVGDMQNINLTRFKKDKAYSLRYSREGKNFGVFVWYDDPFYYFEYNTGD